MAYRESKHFASFREQLREQGATFGTLNQAMIGPDHMMHRANIYRDGKHAVPVVLIDSDEDGYILYLIAATNKVEDDVRLIMEAE